MKTKEDLALERLKGTLLAEGYWQDVLEDFAVIETALNNYYKLLGENEETTKKLKALEIIEDVYAAIKGWCQTTTELQIPIKLLESYYIRWS